MRWGEGGGGQAASYEWGASNHNSTVIVSIKATATAVSIGTSRYWVMFSGTPPTRDLS